MPVPNLERFAHARCWCRKKKNIAVTCLFVVVASGTPEYSGSRLALLVPLSSLSPPGLLRKLAPRLKVAKLVIMPIRTRLVMPCSCKRALVLVLHYQQQHCSTNDFQHGKTKNGHVCRDDDDADDDDDRHNQPSKTANRRMFWRSSLPAPPPSPPATAGLSQKVPATTSSASATATFPAAPAAFRVQRGVVNLQHGNIEWAGEGCRHAKNVV